MRFKVYECVADNAPNYWIVSTSAFRGNVIGQFTTQAEAERVAQEFNTKVSAQETREAGK